MEEESRIKASKPASSEVSQNVVATSNPSLDQSSSSIRPSATPTTQTTHHQQAERSNSQNHDRIDRKKHVDGISASDGRYLNQPSQATPTTPRNFRRFDKKEQPQNFSSGQKTARGGIRQPFPSRGSFSGRGQSAHIRGRTNGEQVFLPVRTAPKQPQFFNIPPAVGRIPPVQRTTAHPLPRGEFFIAHNNPASLLEQSHYVGQVATSEIPKHTILPEELEDREIFRSHLEGLCRETIATCEAERNPNFPADSIKLECFGSLKSGFATRGSDMDMALISPMSEISLASTESPIPRLLENVFLASRLGARLLTRTRVPIIRGCENPSEELLGELMSARIEAERRRLANQALDDSMAPAQKLKEVKDKSENDQTQKTPDGMLSLAAQDSGNEESDGAATRIPNGDTKEAIDEGLDLGLLSGSQPEKSDEELIRLYKLAISEGHFSHTTDQAILHKYFSAYSLANGEQDDPRLISARMSLQHLPDVLSTYRDRRDVLTFPESSGIQWDINFSSDLAMHNTHLLYCYSLCDPRIQQMVIFVKSWAKTRDINSAYRGTLSSYGYVLMVLHYVVNIARPPLAPNLQLELGPTRGGLPGTPWSCEGHNVVFWRDVDGIKRAKERNELTYSRESLGSLLRGFFQYFAEVGSVAGLHGGGFNWVNDVLSLRTPGGILHKRDKGWVALKVETIDTVSPEERRPLEVKHRFLLRIEDPFETDFNVARPVTQHGIRAIKAEFKRANELIQNLGVINGAQWSLFQECKQPEVGRKLYFAPVSRRGGGRGGGDRGRGGNRSRGPAITRRGSVDIQR